ncbi:hypothetical protein [Thermogutta sp.]|uniref:COG1470 family protein n=1 Tax=Thermogutta sp. TaxID=1962930 RepID=UPI0032200681
MQGSISRWITLGLCFVFNASGTFGTAQNASPTPHGDILTRNIAQPLAARWQPGPWNSATATIEWLKEDWPEKEATHPVMEISVRYDGTGFQFASIEPGSLKIPGKLKKIRLWTKPLQPDYTWIVNFRDGEGKDTVNGKKLEWPLNAPPGKWSLLEFVVPESWKQPVSIVSISAHNWNRQNVAGGAQLRIYRMDVETDVTGIAPDERPLEVRITSSAPRNVFVESEPVQFQIICDSWRGESLSAKLYARFIDEQGTILYQSDHCITLFDLQAWNLAWSPPRYGPFSLKVTAQLSASGELHAETRFIYVPRPHALSADEKWRSPWGLNIHSASGGVSYESLRRIGVVWVRDYSYNRQWLLNARGPDGKYSGWPWYPRINKGIQEAELMLLACMGDSIHPYVQKGLLKPDRQWKYDLVHILWAMPDFPAWELDNEYDYHHGKEERAREWRAYQAYHRMFADVVKFMKPDCLAVEQGTARIHPEWVERNIQSGAFEKIDVVNAHFYCGVEPPESSVENANGPGDESEVMLISDRLRAFTRAADCDGRDRQAWITEFGWDTRAGYVVSEKEQAIYLQRGYLMGVASGIDKMFWFWDWDNKEKATTYFDGCGLFDYRNEPKPAAAALAALTHFLKNPQVLGTFDLPKDVQGYVIRDGDRLWGCVFRPQRNAEEEVVDLPGAEFYDMYGNRLSEKPRRVGSAPLWITGFSPDDPIVVESGFAWETPQLFSAVCGETVRLMWSACNQTSQNLQVSWHLESLEGCKVSPAQGRLTAVPGQKVAIPISVEIPISLSQGEHSVCLVVEAGSAEKRLPVKFHVVPVVELSCGSLQQEGTHYTTTVRVRNNSQSEKTWLLECKLSPGWTLESVHSPIRVGSKRQTEIPLRFTIGAYEPPPAPPRLVLKDDTGQISATASIPVPFWNLARVENIKIDGQLEDWPSQAWLPDWLLLARGTPLSVRMALGYNPAGMFLAVHVKNHDGTVTDPRTFWAQTCAELFIDTTSDARLRRSYQATDHQFWLCPLLDTGRVFAGRWKRGDEIPATIYDLPDIQGVSRKTQEGWLMEVFLPGRRLQGWRPDPESTLRANLNLTLPGPQGQTEIYWPASKEDGAPDRPELWGLLRLQ